jgi:hypothetical protein
MHTECYKGEEESQGHVLDYIPGQFVAWGGEG